MLGGGMMCSPVCLASDCADVGRADSVFAASVTGLFVLETGATASAYLGSIHSDVTAQSSASTVEQLPNNPASPEKLKKVS